MLSSPEILVLKSCAAKIPDKSLIVVPELPTSRAWSGDLRPCKPFP